MPSHFISLDQAKGLTANYRGSKEKVLESQFKGQGVLPICETFDRGAFDVLLAKPGCTGIRIYFAMDAENMVRLVIVGVNERNEDMINVAGTGGKDGETDD